MSFFSEQTSLFDSTALSATPRRHRESTETDTGLANQPRAAAMPTITARNFALIGARELASSWKGRAADNLSAIRLLKTLEAAERPASPPEQATLAKFVAFGASELATSLFPLGEEDYRPGWETLGAELDEAVTPAEKSGLMRATQYGHFTPEWIVHALWSAVTHFGFRGGNVLEPGCGSGLFMATVPAKLGGKVAFTGFENDPITARIAGQLFPEFWIRHEDFTRAKIAETYDLVIGNPPFSDRTVHADDVAGRLALSLHDYFIARSIAHLRPGGIAAFVVSRWTLDKRTQTARQHIASMADLIGAVRLPQKAMLAEAGTEVVVDLLVFQRRGEGTEPADISWVETADLTDTDEGEGPLHINATFLVHPERVLGTHAWTSSSYGPTYTCRGDGRDLRQAVADGLACLAPLAPIPSPRVLNPDRPRGLYRPTAIGEGGIREGSYVVERGELHQVIDGVSTVVPIRKAGQKEGLFQKHARIIRALVPVRDHARQVLRLQLENRPYALEQGRLRTSYRSFVSQFGPINQTTISTRVDEETGKERETRRQPNLAPLQDDPDVWLVASIEVYDEASDTARPGPIFTDRVIHPPAEPVVTSAADALAVTLHEIGHVDLPRICELLGRPREIVLAELGEAVFLDPEQTSADREVWITADAALSGPVRTRLATARAAAERDPRFVRNVAALEEVQPPDLLPSDITARLGAPWIPAADVVAFCTEIIGVETTIHHTVEIAQWTVRKGPFAGKAEATSIWGTERRHAGELLEDALTSTIPQIYDVWRDADGEHRVLNAKETEAAKEKLVKIKTAFSAWIWQDPDRAERLLRVYNDTFNNLVPRRFDGAHLRLPGASNVIQLRAHQKRVIWRIIAAGSTYVAHSVGSGKTFSLCAAVMEQKRLGLVSKPMIVVPGHCLAQISREFLMLYPTAKILVADETNFVKARRQRFLARAATAQWDAIIITHDAFKFIGAPAAFESEMISDEIAEFEAILATVDSDDRISRKRIERMKEALEEKFEALKARKDDLLHIGEIGIDQILVDEAQQFRKLSFATNQGNLKGVDPNGSQRAWDLYVKSRYLEMKRPGRGLVLASGTPITNTLGEMFSIQRFMQIEALRERGLHNFDAWAASFGETRTELELQPSGLYKPVTRFCEFVNVADLMAMYRSFADVVLKEELRQHVVLPSVATGKRQIVVAPSGDAFRSYQKALAGRIKAIEQRSGKPQKGDDILLSVLTDGRHAAIDLRFVLPGAANDDDNKLNALIRNAHRIWMETSERIYRNPATGEAYPARGAAQMIFSDLGTEKAMLTRGFSAYRWIRDELIRLGVPPCEIAFMQDYDKSAAKQRLFNSINEGRIRFLIGSTVTMGTGVNAQQRLAALHHLDVPWLVSDIEQREGRIERQGNQNEEIEIYAYALSGSVDANSWGLLERKSRFLTVAMSGDRSIRRLEDVSSEINQFAMAKALASGDMRLMQKAGLEAEIARLERLQAAHIDDQFAVRNQAARARTVIADGERRIPLIQASLQRRAPTGGEAFRFQTSAGPTAERKQAGASILAAYHKLARSGADGEWMLGRMGGFEIVLSGTRRAIHWTELCIRFDHRDEMIEVDRETSPLGLIARIEHRIAELDVAERELRVQCDQARERLPGYEARLGQSFAQADELAAKHAEHAKLERALAQSSEVSAEPSEIGVGEEIAEAA